MTLAPASRDVPGGDAETAPGGMLRSKLLLFVCWILPPMLGLGLLLLKLPIGLAKPLLRPMYVWSKLADCAGASTETWSEWSVSSARMAAAASRTDGTECSSCSVVLERGIRCGFGGWCA
jgi:hypothetical protein